MVLDDFTEDLRRQYLLMHLSVAELLLLTELLIVVMPPLTGLLLQQLSCCGSGSTGLGGLAAHNLL